MSSSEDEQARLVNLGTRQGNVGEDSAVLAKLLAECLPHGTGRAEEKQVEGTGCGTDGAHAVVQPARAKASLDDGKALTETRTATDDARVDVNLDVVVLDFEVAFRSVIVAKDFHRSDKLDTFLLWVDQDK